MSRNELTRDEIKMRVLKLKDKLYREPHGDDYELNLAHKYLDEVLNIIEEYRV